MSTATVTVAELPHIRLAPPPNDTPTPLPDKVIQEAFSDLILICETYADQSDRLSADLFRWCLRVMQLDSSSLVEGSEEAAFFHERINELATEILTDPLDGAPLQEPRLLENPLLGQTTWEGWKIDCYSIHSPDKLDCGSTTNIHAFAMNMIQWLDALSFEGKFDKQSVYLDRNIIESTTNSEEGRLYVLGLFGQLAYEAEMIQTTKALIARLDQGAKILKECWENAVDAIDAQVAATNEANKKHLQAVAESYANIAASHRQTVQLLESDLANAKVAQRSLRAQLQTAQQINMSMQARTQALHIKFIELQNKCKKLRKKAKKWF